MSATNQIRIDRIVDIDPFMLQADFLFPALTTENLRAAALRLPDGHVDLATGGVSLAIQSHLIRVAGKTILIDTCVGEHKSRPLREQWHRRSGTHYLSNLAAAGCKPEDVDFVMCTHLHADHVGWNTRLEADHWVPTFPRARYLMSRREVDQRAREAQQSEAANHGSFHDSVAPLLSADVVDLREPGDGIVDGTLIVDLAGHSPGQIGLKISADSQSPVLFCGDAIHSPLQVLFPELSSRFCSDPALAVETRRRLLEQAVREGMQIIPSHLRGGALGISEEHGRFHPHIHV
jgi:glyoxylase-like metal-dependent hydrolase (beta-lactamase superfamily II)